MSNLQNIQNVSIPKVKSSEPVLPAWRLVLNRELMDLWVGGKAFTLLLIYSVLLGIIVYTYSFNAELSLVLPREAVYEMLKNAMAFSIFMGLIIGADSLSGERDRATLESLLLTPVNRRHIILGKLLAGVSSWPAAYLIAVPPLYVLAQGDVLLGPAMVWGAITGTILVLGYTGMGMLVSYWSSSNKVSYFVSLGFYALLLIPAEFSGEADIAAKFLQWINPISAANYFLARHVIDFHPVAESWTWLTSAVLLAVGALTLLLGQPGSMLHVETRLASRIWKKLKRTIGLAMIIGLMAVSLTVSPVSASYAGQAEVEGLDISIEKEFKLVETGDEIKFNTVVTNNGPQTSAPLIVAMNIINLDQTGEAVDPEEWSPKRTQYIESLASGKADRQSWTITTATKGDFMVYMTLISEAASVESAGRPVASSGVPFTVAPSARRDLMGVLPFIFGGPVVVLVATYIVYRRRRQQIDLGGPS
jgi:ABC-2 type transport system permease protein